MAFNCLVKMGWERNALGALKPRNFLLSGARAQSAKTYLEKNFESFPECKFQSLKSFCTICKTIISLQLTVSDDELVVHALKGPPFPPIPCGKFPRRGIVFVKQSSSSFLSSGSPVWMLSRRSGTHQRGPLPSFHISS